MIHSIAFHSNALNDINNIGKFSDSFPLQRPPGFHDSQ